MGSSGDSGFWRSFKHFQCRDCGSELGFRSRRRTLLERYILPLLLLHPVRCGECFHRDYRSIFIEVRDRLSETRPLTTVKLPAGDTHNVA